MKKSEDSVESSTITDLTVIILTYNEEKNIKQALESVVGWASEILIVDSFSNDRTLEICGDYPCRVCQNAFVDYSKQRNFALDCETENDWVLFLDADEWVSPDLKSEISQVLATNPEENGFYMKRRFIWLGRWVKRGYYPVWILRLFRKSKSRCDERAVNEHIVSEGLTGRLGFDLIHEDHSGVASWVSKHVRYAGLEARELQIKKEYQVESGSPTAKNRWLREKVYNRLPRFIRGVAFFFYRVIVRGGILDGPIVLTYHLLHDLWYRFLIDLLDLEYEFSSTKNDVVADDS